MQPCLKYKNWQPGTYIHYVYTLGSLTFRLHHELFPSLHLLYQFLHIKKYSHTVTHFVVSIDKFTIHTLNA